MTFLSWSSQDKMGVALFDAEHRLAVELANRLHAAVERGEPDTALRHVLLRLIRYTEEHFSHEEEYMLLSGYGDMQRHMAEHARLKLEINGFHRTLQHGNENRAQLAEKVMTFFGEWLMEHIHTEDRMLGVHLNEKGIW